MFNNSFDNAIVDVAFALGIITALTWLILIMISENFRAVYLVQPLLWFFLSWTLRLKNLKRNMFVRLVFSLSFVLTIERLIIIITSIHREYNSSLWRNDSFDESLGWILIIGGLTLKMVELIVLSGLFYWIKER